MKSSSNYFTDSAHIIIPQPIIVGIVNINIMFLRPILSTTPAVNGHPSIPPSGIKAPIQARASEDTLNEY